MVNQEQVGQFVGFSTNPANFSAASFDLYVSSTGNDTTGDGTSSAPFLTLTRAKAVMLARAAWFNQVRIYIMTAGTYVTTSWDGARFVGDGTTPGRLAIIGMDASKTINLSGTITAGSTTQLMNTSALGGVNNYRGLWVVRRNSGGTILDERLIAANTATTITPATQFISAPAITDTFQIVTPGVLFSGEYVVTGFKPGPDYYIQVPNTNVAGFFLVNLQTSACRITSSLVYCKEVVLRSGSSFYSDNHDTRLMLGWYNYTGFAYGVLSWLGAPSDAGWFGAGLGGARQDCLVKGLIDGFLAVPFVWCASRPETEGTVIIRGGAIFGAGNANSLFEWDSGRGKLTLANTFGSDMAMKTLLTNTGGGIKMFSPFVTAIVANASFAVGTTAGDAVQAQQGAEITLDNASLVGGAAVGDGSEVITGGIIRHVGAPVLTGAGGGFDNTIADAVVVNQANAFFAAAGAIMGPSAQQSAIIRVT